VRVGPRSRSTQTAFQERFMSVGHSTTEYRLVEGFPAYRVGSDGSFWSRWQRMGIAGKAGLQSVLTDEWTQLFPANEPDGYIRVILCPGRKRRWLHHLVLEAFVGPCPPGLECCHNDGNTWNNAASNLRWDTKKSNQADRVCHGTSCRGEGHKRSKLTEQQVREIRRQSAEVGTSAARLGKKYSMTGTAILNILHRRTWKHI